MHCRDVRRAISWLILLVIVACTAPKPGFQTAWHRMLDHLSKCSAELGYDPSISNKQLGEHELGKNERQWRACAYTGIETYMIPATVAPNNFRKLVRLDQEMTNQVARGELSRSARKSHISEILAQIKSKEEANQQMQLERLREVQDVMDRQRRMQRMQRTHTEIIGIRRAIGARF